MTDDVRTRILEAAVVCLGRYGIAKTTVDDAAREAGVARATVYRHFPDGKDQLITEAITWAVGQFFTELAAAVEDAPDFATMLERALLHAHHAVERHEVLQKVLETEPERLLPQLTQAAPMVQGAVRGYFEERLAGERLRALEPGDQPAVPDLPGRAGAQSSRHRGERRSRALRDVPAPARPQLAAGRPLTDL